MNFKYQILHELSFYIIVDETHSRNYNELTTGLLNDNTLFLEKK